MSLFNVLNSAKLSNYSKMSKSTKELDSCKKQHEFFNNKIVLKNIIRP